MKQLFLIISLALSIKTFAQDDKTVTLVVSGQGKTKDEAKQVALRSAIEQAFGTFISSKTEILNDNLIKDEIVSVANGNILKYDIISEVQIPEGGYATTLMAIVSVTKLTSFCESKGVEVEFKGELFAMNIKLQKLNEEAEYKAVLDLCDISKKILSKSIDFSLDVSEPVAYNGSSDLFLVNFNVTCSPNKNAKIFEDYFWGTISKLCMPDEEIGKYKEIKKNIYLVARSEFFFPNRGGGCNDCYRHEDVYFQGNKDNNSTSYYLRNKNSQVEIKKLMVSSNKYLYNFRLTSEIDTILITKSNVINDSKEPQLNEYWSIYSNYFYGFPECLLTDKIVGWEDCNSNGEYFLRINKIIEAGSDFGGNLGMIDERQLKNGLGIYIKSIQNINPVKFLYSHILPLSKLERISKFKIEPWENKLN
jgi:hypothetical protein